MQNIIISNQENFVKLKEQIINWWFKNLWVVFDFDRTLTKAFLDNWTFIPSQLSILRDENYLWVEYSKKANDLYNYYSKIEFNQDIDLKERIKYMEEWWWKHLDMLIETWLNKKHLKQIAWSSRIVFRDKVKEIFELLNKNNIPILILSASWIWDEAIIETLKFHNIYFDNISVISNSFIWDDITWDAILYNLPHIHTYNKQINTNEYNNHIYDIFKNKENIILFWDSFWDVNMCKGCNYKNILKIWFLNYDEKENLDDFKKIYNVVITWDWDMTFAYDLLLKFWK